MCVFQLFFPVFCLFVFPVFFSFFLCLAVCTVALHLIATVFSCALNYYSMYPWCQIKGKCVHETGRRVTCTGTALLWFRFDRDHVALPPHKPDCLYFADGIYSARSATQSTLSLNKSLNCINTRTKTSSVMIHYYSHSHTK